MPVLNPYGVLAAGLLTLITVSLPSITPCLNVQIADKEISLKAEIEESLDYIHRQLGRLRVLDNLPRSSEPLENRSRDVKSAAMVDVTVNLAHQYNRLGIPGSPNAIIVLNG